MSERRKLLLAPRLFSLFDPVRVFRAEYDYEALHTQGRVEGEIRRQVEEIYIPIKIKQFGFKCEVCHWEAPSPGRTYMVLHHLKRRMLSSMFLQVYGQRDNWNLKDPEERRFIVDAVVALHTLEDLAWIDKRCHSLRAHPENRQLYTRCKGHIDEIDRLQAAQGFVCEMPDYSRT